jgi:ubiquinone/menaquinone biosynthesis C-methylase UbiE
MEINGTFYELFDALPRGGPGSNHSTLKALWMLTELPEKPNILDIGCGPGEQTIQIAETTLGKITALDNHQPFLDTLTKNAQLAGVSNRIQTINASMFDIPFPNETFDLLWAEGSIFIIGFEKGLQEWKRLLKPGGYLAITEAAWIKENPPQEIADFWTNCYPAMTDIQHNLEIIKNCGYKQIGSFILPESDWMENYYLPMEAQITYMRKKYDGNPEVHEFLNEMTEETNMYRRYKEWYSYIFYILQKPT